MNLERHRIEFLNRVTGLFFAAAVSYGSENSSAGYSQTWDSSQEKDYYIDPIWIWLLLQGWEIFL